jgi:hypothetical protein
MVSLCGVSVGNAAVRGAGQVVHYCNRDGCVDAPMDQYAYGISGLWPGYSHIPDSAQIPPGWTDLVTYHNYACSSSIPITISAELPGQAYGDATTVITVPALGAQTSGTLTFVMPNIGQHLTHGIFVPGVNFLESWGAWPTSDCRLNGRYWGAGPGLETLSIKSVPPGTCPIGLQDSSESVATGTRQAALSPACPLGVTIATFQPLRSGLAVHSQPYKEYPVDFVANKNDADRCQSGCVDLVVTVRNLISHKPVEGAVVNATVSKLVRTTTGGLIQSLNPVVAGAQFLCSTNRAGTKDVGCSNFVAGKYDELLHTDENGQVFLRYWAPGVVETVSTTLNVTARQACSASACPTHEMTGSATTKLTVTPDLIYTHNATLSEDEADEMVAWASGGGVFKKFLTGTTRANTAAKYTLKWLHSQELASEALVEGLEKVEKAEPVLIVVDVVNSLSDLGERQINLAEFLYITDLDAIGLGRDPFEPSVPATPTVTFSNKVVNFGVAVPGELGAAGAWWELAKDVAAAESGGLLVHQKSIQPDMSDWGIKLNVYEVSNCDPTAGYCLPGYGAAERDGMQPELYFKVNLTYNGVVQRFEDFTVPYDAIAWTETQWNLRNVIRDPR